MKKIFAIIFLALYVAVAYPQHDSRNRLPETVVADVLARMPARTHADFTESMADLAVNPEISVKLLSGYLGAYGSDNANAKYEYALSGLVDYCVAVKDTVLASKLRDELRRSASVQPDTEYKKFLNNLAARTAFAGSACITGLAVTDVVSTDCGKVCDEAIKLLKKGDRQKVNAALDRVYTAGCAAELMKKINPKFNKLPVGSKADVLRWAGDNHINAAGPIATMPGNMDCDETAVASLEAASKIGGDKSLAYLESALYTGYAPHAVRALRSFKGDIQPMALRVMALGNDTAVANVLALASKRRMPALYSSMRSTLGPKAASALYAALANCATISNFDDMCGLLDSDTGENVEILTKGVSNAMGALGGSEQYEKLASVLAEAAHPERFYKLLGRSGSGRAVETLFKAYNEDKARQHAFEALIVAERDNMPDILYSIAEKDSLNRDMAAARVCELLSKLGFDRTKRSFHLRRLLSMNLTDKTRNSVISALGTTASNSALMAVSPWLDNAATAKSAATAVKTIVSQNKSLQGHDVTNGILAKAMAVFKADTADADAGYAVDEIKLLMDKAAVRPAELSKQEQDSGFELLFDGLTLKNWHGNTLNYTPEDGCIYVTAGYGSEGNLYTDKDYSDFVFRFEFMFLEPGVNNGVGIRTSEGLDAAYHGMEIQILDHDAPVYKGLRPYQQHGAVYGIIVPEHVDFGPVGTWHTEEIRAVGDRITVTVDGKVILDGDIRKACKGHNVAPDGSGNNPYTVDGQNHPGLFNKSGKISFCGHGEGLKFRNIRILDLLGKK